MRSAHLSSLFALTLVLGLSACDEVNFDGLYDVASLTLNDMSCDAPGTDVAPDYTKFRVKGKSLFGVDIYPVYPCDDSGVCAEDNDAEWGLVVVEDDLGQVGEHFAYNDGGNGCVLNSVDRVVEKVEESVVFERRTYSIVVEPYDPDTCTTDRAKSMRKSMECVDLLQLVGTPDPSEASM